MAQVLKVKRSAVASRIPTVSDLQLGEIAINTFDGKLYFKKNNGSDSIVDVIASAAAAVGNGFVLKTGDAMSGALTITLAGASALTALSGSFVTGTAIGIGRTTGENQIAVAANNGDWTPNSTPGDLVFRVGASNNVVFGRGTSTYTAMLNSSGFLGVGTVPTSVLHAKSSTQYAATLETTGSSVNVTSGNSVGVLMLQNNNTTGNYTGTQFINAGGFSQGSMGIKFGSHTAGFNSDYYIEPLGTVSVPTTFVLKNSGALGLGVAAPLQKIHTKTTSGGNYIQLDTVSGATAYYGNDNTNAVIQTSTGASVAFLPSGVEKVRINSTGEVGMGKVAGSGATLDILNGSIAGIRLNGDGPGYGLRLLNTNGTGGFSVNIGGSGSASGGFLSADAGPMWFVAGASERIRINTLGNVGINQPSPAYTLDVTGYGRITGALQSGGAGLGFSFLGNNSGNKWFCIAQLPGTSLGTYDHIQIICTINDNWGSGANRVFKLLAGNRNGFFCRFISMEGGALTPAAGIQMYKDAGDNVQVYAYVAAGFFSTCSVDIITSQDITIFPDAQNNPQTTTPSGTLQFDSATGTPGWNLDAISSPSQGLSLLSGPSSYMAIGHASAGSGTSYQAFYYNGTLIGNIAQSGTTAVVYNTTSDERRKENIVDSLPAGHVIDAMKVRAFEWKSDGSHVDYGFIAQELNTAVPAAVTIGGDDPNTQPWGVDYSKIVPVLVKEIQDLRARVAALEAANVE